jgi:sulfoxide reductase heme-binding subunit YedZ
VGARAAAGERRAAALRGRREAAGASDQGAGGDRRQAAPPRARTRSPLAHPLVKPVVFAACLVPLAALGWNAFHDNLGANPIEALEITTGVWTLRFLVITLAITPARKLLGWNGLVKYRRMFGLFTFAYASIHLSMYIGVDMFFNMHDIVHDVVKHPYITVGMASFLMLLPLALTSTNAWVKRLGGRRWLVLHRLVYLIAAGGTLHYMWAVKKDIRYPLTYAAIFALLLGYRAWMTYGKRRVARVAAG